MNKAKIQIAYSGEAVESGSMDVRDIAPALLAIGDLCQQANRVLTRESAEMSVNVRADFKEGSFEVSMELVQVALAQAAMFGPAIKTAKDIASLLGLVDGGGLIGLVKWLRGRKVKGSRPSKDKKVIIEVDASHNENSHVEVNIDVARLFDDNNVHKAIREVVRPLEKTGIDRFEVRKGKQVLESLTREETPSSLLVESDSEMLTDSEQIVALEIVKVSFDEKLKWMFSDGATRFHADMEDQDFLNKLHDRRISFIDGDVLVVRLRTRTWETSKGLQTERVVLEVKQIKHAPRQLPLTDS